MKTYLALKNKTMKKFLENCDFLEIHDDLDYYDVMFCDTLELGENIQSNIKFYLACNYFESLDDLQKYKEYDYFIGFGDESLYDYFQEEFSLECSKIFNGFVKNEEEEIINKEDDIVVSHLEENYNDDSEMFQVSQHISKDFFRILNDSNFKVFFNHPSPNPIYLLNNEKKQNYKWIEDTTIDLLENSNFIFTDSVLNCRIYFNEDLLKKTILPDIDYHSVKETIKKINLLENNSKKNELKAMNIINKINLNKNNFYYLNVFNETPFKEFNIKNINKKKRISFYKLKNKINNKKYKKYKFLIYEHNFKEIDKKTYPLYAEDIISLYKIMTNFDKIEKKENKIIKINNISNEFIETLKKVLL